METIAEKLKNREDMLVVARDAELEHRWDLAMKIRDDVSINVGWYDLWQDVDKLLREPRVSLKAFPARAYRIKRVWGSTILGAFSHPVIWSESDNHAVLLEMMRADAFVVLRINRNFDVTHDPSNKARLINTVFIRDVQAKPAASAGEALSLLTDDERERMKWR